MCGIAGICCLQEPKPISLDVVERMTAALNHRGPDGSGIYLDDRVGLGHTRLSIIDLAGGAQPIHNEDERFWIVFNGEIFNYPELRAELIQKGHRFSTATDTEAVLHLYEERGPSCLDALNGQFALAIWDSVKKELFLARDRYGILPLYYTVTKDSLVFASEIKSLFTVPGVSRRIDPLAMDQIFTFWTTLADRTVFQDIHEVPAGHFMTLSRGSIKLRQYWAVPFSAPEAYATSSLDELTGSLRELINDAVRIRLRADVPVGCYVSGGLDSSGITALVKKRFNNDLKTFGIRFEDKAFDESEHQKHLVDSLGTVHRDILARNEEIGASLSAVLWHCEKPLLRTAPVPLFLLSRLVRENGYKVVLTGEGADEVFGGYDIFREAKILKFWSRQPQSRSRPRLFGRLYPYIFQDNPRARHFVQSFFGTGMRAVGDPLFSHLVRWNTTQRIKTFFSEDLRKRIGEYSGYDDLKACLPRSYASLDYLSRAQYLEMSIFMSNYLLSSQGDRVAMAHAVEIRPPFLDHRIMDFMGRVPLKWRIKGLNEKYLLKEAFRELVPENILKRQKHPYRAPINSCLLNAGNPLVDQHLSDSSLQESGLFEPVKVRRLLAKMRTSRKANEVDSMALAGILSTQIIHQQFISRFPDSVVKKDLDCHVIDKRTGSARVT